MSNTSNNGPYPEIGENDPFYTKELLQYYEAEAAKDSDVIKLRTIQGHEYSQQNPRHGAKPWDLAQDQAAERDLIMFADERSYNDWAAEPRGYAWISVQIETYLAHGPWKTEQQARESFNTTFAEFAGTSEASNIELLVKQNLAGCHIDKVFGFGLGSVSWALAGLSNGRNWSIQSHEREHAALIVVARAIQQVSSADKVQIFTQDPGYQSVDKQILGEHGIEVIESRGALGFTMVDDNSAVFAHHPNFCFREIIADLARPKLICMESQEKLDSQRGDPYFDFKADIGSKRSRKMLQQYRMEKLGGVVRGFFDNVWYIREEMREVETETPQGGDTQPSKDSVSPELDDKKKKKKKTGKGKGKGKGRK
ncbi:hypothetical protein F5Y18DRAFT_422721 [Xylariaceae sp. FL1019]|nr:hypothetical protein F5Y18DRAFT_422721 [Xylariaceae sp. FL1019]